MKDNDSSNLRKERVITLNKKAFHDYEISNKYEAGIVLAGTEVKSLRGQKANIQDAYAKVKDLEIWLVNSHIPIYKHGNITNHEPLRERKLLLHRNEIKKINTKLKDKGYTLIPLKLYFTGQKVKVELALARGKKFYDKRESIKKEEVKRRLKRVKIH
ncbi:MAG: SsrA-binding protein SmpB [Ignavibacteria bacterium]